MQPEPCPEFAIFFSYPMVKDNLTLSSNEIGRATAEKRKEFCLVIWWMHGIYAAGKTVDETFGLIETVEKATQVYMLTTHLPRINTIRDSRASAACGNLRRGIS